MRTIDQFLINKGEKFSTFLFVVACTISIILVLCVFLIIFKMGDDERSDYLASKTAAIVLLINCALNNWLMFGSIQHWKLFLCTNFLISSFLGLLFISRKYFKSLR